MFLISEWTWCILLSKVQQGFLLVSSPGKPCSEMSGLANLILGMCDIYACKRSDYTCLRVSSHIFIVYNLLLLIEARKTCIFNIITCANSKLVLRQFCSTCCIMWTFTWLLLHSAVRVRLQYFISNFNICVRGAIFSSIGSQDIWYSNTKYNSNNN